MSQSTPSRLTSYVKNHMASLGTLLFAYGAFYLFAVIRTGWVPTDGVTVVHRLESLVLYPPTLNPLVVLAFFVTSLSALIIGTVLLCAYSVKAMRNGVTVHSEHVAVLLTVFGFAYQVLGAWPLQTVVDFAWDWQKQIMNYGAVFAWGLYFLSFVGLVIGAVSLFVHSRDYHRRQRERDPINSQ
jgi:hypothetical protein